MFYDRRTSSVSRVCIVVEINVEHERNAKRELDMRLNIITAISIQTENNNRRNDMRRNIVPGGRKVIACGHRWSRFREWWLRQAAKPQLMIFWAITETMWPPFRMGHVAVSRPSITCLRLPVGVTNVVRVNYDWTKGKPPACRVCERIPTRDSPSVAGWYPTRTWAVGATRSNACTHVLHTTGRRCCAQRIVRI